MQYLHPPFLVVQGGRYHPYHAVTSYLKPNIMLLRQWTILHLIISISTTLFLTSCANRPYFVIENKSPNEIKIELVYDSLNVNEIVIRDIISKKISNQRTSKYYADSWEYLTPDSIKNTMLALDSSRYIFKYLRDSLSLYSLRNSDNFGIANLDKVEPYKYGSGEYYTDFRQNAFTYYHNDTMLIKKIIHNKTISFILPPNFSFFKKCSSCGDCSCDVESAFPNAKEVRIVFDKDDYITLTAKNFKRIMQKDKFNGETNSYVFVIK